VCHVNYYHKVCVCVCVLFSSLSLNRHSRMMILWGEGGGFFRTASSSRLSFPIHVTDPRFVSFSNALFVCNK
jgi:hypothetical protein